MATYTYSDFIKDNAAPYAADHIGVYNSGGERVGYIPLNKLKPNYGERLYRFGLLSDVHNETDQTTESSEDLKNAIQYFNDKEDVEFAIISGDLTQYSYSTQNISTEMSIFQTNQNAVAPHLTIYPTTGNHDCPNSSDVDISTFYSYTDASSIAPSSGCEFSYEVTKTHTTSAGTTVTDHFLFLTMRRYEFTSSTYSDTDITWLGTKLEEYKNDRCFIITHMFFPTYAGNLNDIYPSGNWLSGNQLTSLKALIDKYPRTIWFSGHSHWKWYLQKYQDRANIYPTSNIGRTGGWAVHLPSCASPIDSDGTTRVSMAQQSEAGVCDVYEDCVVIRGIVFKDAEDTDYVHRYLPIAQYLLKTDPEEATDTYTITIEGENFTVDNTTTSVQTGNGYGVNILPNTGYAIASIAVTMDGADITSSSVNGTNVTVASVTGDVIITVITKTNDYKITYVLNESTATNLNAGADEGDTYTTQITHNSGYKIESVSVVMNGVDVSSDVVTDSETITDKTITISSVTGDIVITVTTSVALTTLVAKLTAISTGLALMVNSADFKYLKYDGIKVQLVNSSSELEDITSAIVTTDDSNDNSYKIGSYNSNSKYQYVPAGEILTTVVNTNTTSKTGYQIPLVQSSSQSSVATNNIYVQLKGIKVSGEKINWVEVNDGSTLLNGTSWGKYDLSYGWFEDITDDPSTLTLSTTGNTATS